jgi:hypothetical protein
MSEFPANAILILSKRAKFDLQIAF